MDVNSMGVLSERQVLITGVYRSGTEYVTQLLNNHPQLAARMYVVSFMRFCWDRYNPIDEAYQYTRLLFDAGQRIYYRWNRKLDIYGILSRLQKGPVTYASLYDAMMADLFCTDETPYWAEKTQLAWTKIGPFLDMFPEGKAILIVRDPRNVMLSFKKITYAPEPAYLGAAFNCLDAMSKGLSVQSEYGKERVHIIRYEDLLTDPETYLVGIFDFLGLTVEHELLKSDHWTDESGNPWVHNTVHTKDSAPDTAIDFRKNIYKWKAGLSVQDAAFCDTIVGGMIDRYGYEPGSTTMNWDQLQHIIAGDEKLSVYLDRWGQTGEGVEAFPTDPLQRKNWAAEVIES